MVPPEEKPKKKVKKAKKTAPVKAEAPKAEAVSAEAPKTEVKEVKEPKVKKEKEIKKETPMGKVLNESAMPASVGDLVEGLSRRIIPCLAENGEPLKVLHPVQGRMTAGNYEGDKRKFRGCAPSRMRQRHVL